VLAPFAILVGTWTHLLWDSFTHDNGWVVRRVAALSAPITVGDYTGTMCHILQYVSSVAGLLILAIWFRRLPTPAVEPPAIGALSLSARTVLLVLVCVTAASIGGYKAAQIAAQGVSNYHVIYMLLTRSIAWFAVLYFATGLFVSLTRKPEPVAEV
jgi:preprotein translocase subunit SecG